MLLLQANLDHQKTLLKQENKTVLDAVTTHFEQNPSSTHFVKLIPSISANTKAISEALKTIASKTLKEKTVYLLAAEGTAQTDAGGRVVHGCYVAPSAQSKGLDATKWSLKVAEAVGGKAGGKGATSLGQGTKVEGVDEAVDVAEKYLAELGI